MKNREIIRLLDEYFKTFKQFMEVDKRINEILKNNP